MEETTLQFEGKQDTYSASHGSDFLGGGQTAAVYRVTSSRGGQQYALKLLTDLAYQQRFFQEVYWLSELEDALAKEDIAPEGRLTPHVYDEQRQGDQRFFVMDLAPGKPLDELWREAPQGRLDLPDALRIASQMARVFAALHRRLNRSYLDFQPKNVFWDAVARQIMVIDWNLLSLSGQADVAGDIRTIGYVLYRMALGSPPAGQSRQLVASHSHWPHLPLGVRRLLLDVLAPLPAQEINNAFELSQWLELQSGRLDKTADEVVQEAAVLSKSFPDQQHDTPEARAALINASELLDLAQARRDEISPIMRPVLDKLQAEVAERQRAGSAVRRSADTFVKISFDQAKEAFAREQAEAQDPLDSLQIARWLAILDARDPAASNLDEARRGRIADLLESFRLATLAYQDPESAAGQAVPWEDLAGRVQTLQQELEGAPHFMQALSTEATTWPELLWLLAYDGTGATDSSWQDLASSAAGAQAAVDELPYARQLWRVLGAGDGQEARNRIAVAVEKLELAAETEDAFVSLVDDAASGRWSEISVERIKMLFDEYASTPLPIAQIRTFLGAAIGKNDAIPGYYAGRAGELAMVLLEGLGRASKLSDDTRDWAKNAEHSLLDLLLLEMYLHQWKRQGDRSIYSEARLRRNQLRVTRIARRRRWTRTQVNKWLYQRANLSERQL
ncbi:MAG: hypothetical protein KDE45_17840 [Caldilineaceae bacterium]|nr:hypothetical protein [Caldilineaceae bacterium]